MNRINLSQVKRCNQVWEEMTPNEQGRLCQKCSKNIIDFRGLTDKEVAEIHVFSSEPVCGLYNDRQLRHPSEWSAEKQRPNWKSFYFGLGGLLLSNTLAAQEVMDTVNVIQVEQDYDVIEEAPSTKQEQEVAVKDTIIISGVVTDESGEVLIGVPVYLQKSTYGTVTDFNGQFLLDITNIIEELDQVRLEFSYVAFNTIEIDLNKELLKEEENRILTIKMNNEDSGYMIEFALKRTPLHKRIWYKIRNVFRKRH